MPLFLFLQYFLPKNQKFISICNALPFDLSPPASALCSLLPLPLPLPQFHPVFNLQPSALSRSSFRDVCLSPLPHNKMVTLLHAASAVFLTMLAARLLVAGAEAAVSNATDTNIPRIYSYSDRALIHATFATTESIVAGVDAVVPSGSYNGDDILATTATLNEPLYATLDAQGNIFISDSRNNRIRRVDKNTGIITTVAGGSSASAFSGDGGLATLAGINYPKEIIFDLFGDMFFSDWSNKRIRKITTSTGIITTVVGTGETKFNGENILGTSTSTSSVSGLACDSEGNLFYSDLGFYRIRKLTRSTGIVNTVAGTGLYPGSETNYNNVVALKTNVNPTCLIIDASGNLYFTRGSGTGYLKLTMTTGTITTKETNDIVFTLLIGGSGNIYFGRYFNPRGQVFEVVKIGADGGFESVANNLVNKLPTYIDAADALYVPAPGSNIVLKYTPHNGVTAPPTRQPTPQSAPSTRPPVTITAPPTRPPVTVTAPPTRQSTPNLAPIRPSHKPTKFPRGQKPSRAPRSRPPR